jgi:DNA-binding XRE family transcriptional regulator
MKKTPTLSAKTKATLIQISDGLRAAREGRAEPQEDAAQRIGVSLATYQRLESGQAEKLASIATGSTINALLAFELQLLGGHQAGR